MTRPGRAAMLAGAVMGVAACHGKMAQPAGSSPSAAPHQAAPPPPLDTSWERDAERVLAAGESAPDFEGLAHTGMRVRLSSFLQRPVVVYFYGAGPSGEATAAARAFRDAWLRLVPVCGMVLGVSTDDRVRHRDFATAEELPFLLVADEARKIARAYGVPGTDGRSRPVTFVVGKDRKVVSVFSEPSADGHAREVLALLESLR